MNGNFSRTTSSGGPSAPFKSQQNPPIGNGFVFTGHGGRHCFSGRRVGPCNGTRSFHTGRGSYGRYQHPPRQQSPQMAPSPPPVSKEFVPPHLNNSHYHTNPQGFINGIKKIVNGFINPKLNCDFYSDHHRFYNPMYRNNYMMDRRAPPVTLNVNNCNPGVRTVFVGKGHSSSGVPNGHHMPHQNQSENQQPAPSATFEFTIFTSDDFPALPEVKKQTLPDLTPAVTKVSNKLPRRRRKARDSRSPKKSTTPPTDTAVCEDFVVLSKPKINKDPTPVASVLCQSPVKVAAFPWRYRPRVRQISECSDDSFVICFSEEAPEGVLEVTRVSDDDDDDEDDSDLSGSSSEDDDTIDETDNHLKVPDIEHLDSGFEEKKDKKVRFNLQPEVHVMYKWDYAYRAARKGDWEKYARDRDRFRKRIERLSNIINPALDTQHRENIYRTRFCDSDKNDASTTNDQQNSTTNNSSTKSTDEIEINNIKAKAYHV